MNLKIETYAGDMFGDVALKAKAAAGSNKAIVEFEFNGVACLVSFKTNLKHLWRDYRNAHLMEWKTIGPHCVQEYSTATLNEISSREEQQRQRQQKREAERQKKDEADRTQHERKISDIEMEFSDKAAWDEWRAKNTDGYGNACFEYAEAWAKLMQKEMAEGSALESCAEKTSFELGFMGITGFMYGVAVNILSTCWKHGETLRKWHNKKYGHDGTGVVNPAVLTLGK